MIMGPAVLGDPPMTTSTQAHLRPHRCHKGHRSTSIYIASPKHVSRSGPSPERMKLLISALTSKLHPTLNC